MLEAVDISKHLSTDQDEIEYRLTKAQALLVSMLSNDNFETLKSETIAALLDIACELIVETRTINGAKQ